MDIKKLKNENTFSIKMKSKTKAEITIYSDIGNSFFGDSISAKDFDRELNKLDPTINQIDLRVNSPGGDVFDGITIYNRLLRHSAKVTAYVDGIAASIASVIILAADEIIMGEGAMVMIHKPHTIAMGNDLEMLDVVDRLQDVENQILGIYKKKTNLDQTELRAMLAKTTWFDAEQAVESGFAHKIADEMEFSIAASLDRAEWITKRPKFKSQNEVVKEETNKILENMKGFLAR